MVFISSAHLEFMTFHNTGVKWLCKTDRQIEKLLYNGSVKTTLKTEKTCSTNIVRITREN